MQVEIHGFTVVMHGMKDSDVKELCNDILHVNYDLFIMNSFGNRKTLKHRFSSSKSKECVYIVRGVVT